MNNAQVDHIAAAIVAFEAGQLLLSMRGGTCSREVSADVMSDRLIAERLRTKFPDDAILSEEAVDGPERLGRDRVWIVDPLDGTREYGEPHRDDWAVHVTLFQEGSLRAGAVVLPANAMVFSTASPLARTHLPRADGPIRLAVSRTRPPIEAQRLQESLGVILVPMGSAGAKAMAVVRGEVDGYIHAGGQYEWDSAAPVAVAQANALHASRINGSSFQWNQKNPWQPDLLICRPEYASLLLDHLNK